MEKFNLSEWLQDKSRKVVTRSGIEVEIIHDENPLVAIINGVAYNFVSNGKFQSNKSNHKYDLFFADEEEELTEFEKMLRYVLECYSGHEFASESEIETLKLNAKSLLDLARKELQQEFKEEYDRGYSIGQFDKGEEKVKELVSEDLEEEMIRWHKEHFGNKRDWEKTSGEYLTRESQLDLARHFSEWQKQRMMNDVFIDDYIVHDGRIEVEGDPLPSVEPIILLPYPKFKPNDKVKIIIVKDDQQ